MAAGVACLVILVQATALGVLVLRPTGSGEPGAGPGLASGGPTPVSNGERTALIRFNPNAKAEDINALLRAMNAQIIDGPKPGGGYRVRISNRPLRSEEIDAILRQLRERSDIIDFAGG